MILDNLNKVFNGMLDEIYQDDLMIEITKTLK